MDHPLARMPSLAATFLYSPPQRLRCSASHFSNPTLKLLQPTPLARDPLHHWKQTHSRIPSPFHLPHLSISNPPLCIAPANSYGRVPAPSHNTSGSRSKAEHLYLLCQGGMCLLTSNRHPHHILLPHTCYYKEGTAPPVLSLMSPPIGRNMSL